MNIFVLICLIILFPCLIRYLYFKIGNLLKYYKKYNKKHAVILTVLYIIVMLSFVTTISVVFIFMGISALIVDGIYFLLKHIWKKYPKKKFDKIFQSGLLILGLTSIFLIYGYWNMGNIKYTNYSLTTQKESIHNSLTIVQISDLHFGSTISLKRLAQELKKVEELNPDLVVLTGDIFDERTKKSELLEVSKLLGKIDSTYGTYFVLGNHDPNHYSRGKNYTEEELLKVLDENNIQSLIDETELIDNQFYLIGRKDITSKNRKTLKELTMNLDHDKYLILLDHQPFGVDEKVNLGIDLELCGHTHDGQIWPFGQVISLLDMYPTSYGKYQQDSYTMLVSSGVGTWNYPIRTSNHSEIVVITVTRKEDK